MLCENQRHTALVTVIKVTEQMTPILFMMYTKRGRCRLTMPPLPLVYNFHFATDIVIRFFIPRCCSYSNFVYAKMLLMLHRRSLGARRTIKNATTVVRLIVVYFSFLQKSVLMTQSATQMLFVLFTKTNHKYREG